MANLEGFVKKVQEKTGMRPIVPLGTYVKIGDIGRIGPGGQWQPVSTTRRRFRVAPQDVRDVPPKDEGLWDGTSGKEVRFRAYGKGDISKLFPKVADAKIRTEIEFESKRSFVFAARGIRIDQAGDIDDVLRAIRIAYHRREELPQDRRWEKDLCFVFAVGEAKRLTALLSEYADTTVAISGKGKFGPPRSAGELSLSIEVGISSNDLTKQVQVPARMGTFYRAYKLDPSVFQRWDREREKEVGAERRGLLAEPKEAPGAVAPPRLTREELQRLEAKPLPTTDQAIYEA